MGSITHLIVGHKITNILFSKSYCPKDYILFAVWIDLSNGTRFRLIGYGASFTDVNNVKDLYSINIDNAILPRNIYIGQTIIEEVTSENEFTYLLLENGYQLGVIPHFQGSRFQIGIYPWLPDKDN